MIEMILGKRNLTMKKYETERLILKPTDRNENFFNNEHENTINTLAIETLER